MKRGLASPWVASALATTRRLRLQVERVVHMKLLKRRSGLPVRRLFASARSSSLPIAVTSRSLRANPNTKSTALASHHVIRSSRAKPESARSTMRVRGHRVRMRAARRATSSSAPAAASMLARRSLATSRWRPQNT